MFVSRTGLKGSRDNTKNVTVTQKDISLCWDLPSSCTCKLYNDRKAVICLFCDNIRISVYVGSPD